MSEAKITLTAVDKTAAGIAAAKARLTGLGSDAELLATRFSGLGAGIASALTLGGFAAFFNSVTNGLDALNDMADATGASIDKLGGLEDVAARTGTSMETVGASLLKLNQVLNNAKPGSEQEAALRAIGLSAKELRDIDPADALQRVAVAMAGYADDGNKARLMQELFGKSTRDMAPLLKDIAENGVKGADGLSQQASAAEDFRKRLASASKDAQDLGRAVVSDLLPGLNAVFESMRSAGDEGARFGGVATAIRTIFESLAVSGANVAFVFGAVGRQLGAWRAQVDALERMDMAGFDAISRAVKEDGINARKELEAFEARVMRTAGAAREAGGGRGFVNPPGVSKPSVGGVPAAGAAAGASVDQYDRYVERLRESLRATQDLGVAEQTRVDIAEGKLGRLTAAQREYLIQLAEVIDLSKKKPEFVGPEIDPADIRAFEELQQLIAGSKGSQTEALAEKARRLGDAFNRGAFTADEYSRGIEVITDRLQGLQPKLEETSEFAAQAARNIQDAMGDSLVSALDGDFKSIGKLWENMLKRIVAQAAAAQISKYLLGDGFAKTGEVGGALGGLGTWLQGLGKADGSHATGLNYVPFDGYRAVLHRGERVQTANEARQADAGGGAGISLTMNVAGDVSAKTVRLVRNELAMAQMRAMRAGG